MKIKTSYLVTNERLNRGRGKFLAGALRTIAADGNFAIIQHDPKMKVFAVFSVRGRRPTSMLNEIKRWFVEAEADVKLSNEVRRAQL